VKTNQTNPPGLTGSEHFRIYMKTPQATLRSCNYTELTPANDNISIPYTPIEYIIVNFEMLQL